MPGRGMVEFATIVPLWGNHTLKCAFKGSGLLLEVGAAMEVAIFIIQCAHLRTGYVHLILFLLPWVYIAVDMALIILFRGSDGKLDCFPGN